jgi:hypothetical protein
MRANHPEIRAAGGINGLLRWESRRWLPLCNLPGPAEVTQHVWRPARGCRVAHARFDGRGQAVATELPARTEFETQHLHSERGPERRLRWRIDFTGGCEAALQTPDHRHPARCQAERQEHESRLAVDESDDEWHE